MIILLFALSLCTHPDSLRTIESNPDTLDISMIRAHSTYFQMVQDTLIHADSLIILAKASQFVTIGEIHNSRRISEFTSVLMNLLKPSGFDHLIVETGPYSAEKLESLIKRDKGKEEVRDFYSRYSSNTYRYYPIPFFTGKADLNMLKEASDLTYHLWGIDQEFAFSTVYLAEELRNVSAVELTKTQKEDLSKIKSKLKWWYRRYQLFRRFNLNCKTKNYQPFQNYLASFTSPNQQQQAIIQAIERSLDIYCLSEKGQWKESNEKRIDYFKSNFRSFYERAKNEHGRNEPKAIIKMGSYHSGRSTSPIGIYDIGHTVSQLTDSLGTTSLHLRFLNRYFEDGTDVIDDKLWASSKKFISSAKKDTWTLIDSRPLRKRILEGSLVATRFETRELLNYDFILIAPEDVRAVKHYK